MSRSLILLSGLLLAALPVAAAEAEDPNAAATMKLREALRNTTLQLRTVQTDLAAAKAAQVAAEARLADLTARSEAAAREAASSQADARKQLEKLAVDNDTLEANLTKARQLIEKLGGEYNKLVVIANTREEERVKLADQNSILRAKVRDHRAQNLELFTLANEILVRYEEFGLGKALKAREPFTRITRARLETQVQDYRDRADDLKLPADVPAKTAVKKR